MKKWITLGVVLVATAIALMQFHKHFSRSSSVFLNWQGLRNQKIQNLSQIEADEVHFEGETDDGIFVLVYRQNLSSDKFENLWKGVEFKLNTVYQDHQLPYANRVASVVQCPSEFQPVSLPKLEVGNLLLKGVTLFADERMVIGACDLSRARFRVLTALAACKDQNRIYELKVFVAISEEASSKLASIYDSFSCY